MQPCDREGHFRAAITDAGLKEMESGAIAVAIKATLLECWDQNAQAWVPWAEYEMEAEGDLWIVKKTGEINQGPAQSLIQFAGWDGNLESIINESWRPTECQVVVKRDEYEGKSRLKISYVNDRDRVPGGLSNVNADKARELQSRFGSQLRAIAGNCKRNGTPATTGRPAAPPRPAALPPPRETAPAEDDGAMKIPF